MPIFSLPQHHINRPRPAMPGVGVAHRQYLPRMRAVAEPGGEFAANGASRGFVGAATLAGDDQYHPRAARHRPVKRAGQRAVRAGEMVAVEVDGHVGAEATGAEIAFPVLGEGGSLF